jgi:hypothetical protein
MHLPRTRALRAALSELETYEETGEGSPGWKITEFIGVGIRETCPDDSTRFTLRRTREVHRQPAAASPASTPPAYTRTIVVGCLLGPHAYAVEWREELLSGSWVLDRCIRHFELERLQSSPFPPVDTITACLDDFIVRTT